MASAQRPVPGRFAFCGPWSGPLAHGGRPNGSADCVGPIVDLSGIETAEPALHRTKPASESVRRRLRHVVRSVAAVVGLAAAALVLLALAQAALDAGLAGTAWDVVDIGR